MPTSTVESPYGLLQVEHPEGASDAEILDYAQKNYQPHPLSLPEKLMQTWPARMGQDILQGAMAPGRAFKGELGPAGSRETTEAMIKPAAELAGVVAGDTPFASNIPTKDQIFDVGSKAFDAARALGAKFHPDLIPSFSRIAKVHLDQAGFPPGLAPKVHDILDNHSLSTVSQDPTTVNDILSFRKKLKNAQGVTDPQDKAAATISKNAFDTVLDNMAPYANDPNSVQAAALLKEGRDNWAAAERLETIDKKQAAAEIRAGSTYSGFNTANKIRQNLASVLLSPKQSAGWSPEAIDQATKVVMGTPVGNTARYIGNYLGKGGGMGGLAATVAGGLVGGAPGAVAAAGTGIAARLVDLASTERQTALLRALLAKESPLAQYRAPSTVPSDAVSKLISMLLTNQAIPNMTNTLNNGSQTQ